MGWLVDLPQWFDLEGRPTGLQELPVLLELRAVDLGPSLDEPLLRLWQALDGVDGENGRVFLVIRVKVRSMMLPAGFNEHANYDSEKRESSGTAELYITSSGSRRANVMPLSREC
jgi:hypothetical protein